MDEGEDLLTGLNREILEELGPGVPQVEEEDWICTHYAAANKLVLHFYCKVVRGHFELCFC